MIVDVFVLRPMIFQYGVVEARQSWLFLPQRRRWCCHPWFFRFQLLGYTCPVWPVALQVSKDALGGASGGAGDPKTETGTKKESEAVDDEKAPRSSPVFSSVSPFH